MTVFNFLYGSWHESCEELETEPMLRLGIEGLVVEVTLRQDAGILHRQPLQHLQIPVYWMRLFCMFKIRYIVMNIIKSWYLIYL